VKLEARIYGKENDWNWADNLENDGQGRGKKGLHRKTDQFTGGEELSKIGARKTGVREQKCQ